MLRTWGWGAWRQGQIVQPLELWIRILEFLLKAQRRAKVLPLGFSSERGRKIRQRLSCRRRINPLLFPRSTCFSSSCPGLSQPGSGDFLEGKKKKSRFLLRLSSRHVLRDKHSGFWKAPKKEEALEMVYLEVCRFGSFLRGQVGSETLLPPGLAGGAGLPRSSSGYLCLPSLGNLSVLRKS